MVEGDSMREDHPVPRRLPKRSLLRVFTMGASAPAFLVEPASDLRPLRNGETLQRAWASVGWHISHSLSRINERRG